MFDKYVVVDGSLHNVITATGDDGFAVDLRIPYYRGLGLSMVTVNLTVDGDPVDPRQATFTVHGNSYSLNGMDEVFDDRWPFTEPATITVTRPGGLAEGEHTITALVHLRVSYAPGGFSGRDSKKLRVVELATK